ncbi:alpha/beta hydrolase [Rhodobacteraceae bacterium D3-12]|nr:alpha/beta hydrolase [Rhodobacteraceae bacterium D3-12]
MIWALLLIGVMVLGLAEPFLRELRKPSVRAFEDEAPGAFAELSAGRVHYRWSGQAVASVDGPVMVLVHGLTTPSFMWDALEAPLVAKGYRVLRYDLYGRGYSDRPRGAQDAAFFVTQLEELLAHEGITGPVTLVGYSMGGAIGTAFAAKHPVKVSRLVLLAPAGMGHALGAAERLVALPGLVAEWLMLWMFPARFRAGVNAERDDPRVPDAVVAGQLAQLQRRGYLRSVLESLRGILSEDRAAEHRAIAAAGLPVLAVWGQVDETIPIAAKAVLEQWNGAAEHVVLGDAGHALPYTHAAEVADAI